MDSYDLSGFSVVVCDFKGEQIKPDNYNVLESFSLKYKLETGSTENHGYYKREDGSIITEEINITLKYDTTEKCYKQDDTTTVTMRFAGRYDLYLSKNIFTGMDNDISLLSVPDYIILKEELPGFRVYSVSPSVGITYFDPSGEFYYNKSSGKEGYEKIYLSPLVEPTDSVTVYLECTKDTNCFGTFYYYYNPVRVDMEINNAGSNFLSASLPFKVASDSSAEVHMYTKSTTSDKNITSEYIWTTDKATTIRYIGKVSNTNKTVAGKLEANQLVVTASDGIKYLFSIPTITINNPY